MSSPSLQLTSGTFEAPARVSLASLAWPFAEKFIAACLLVLLLPALTGIVVAVLLASRRSPFIAHRRVGRYGSEFWMLKIRTMWDRETLSPRLSTETGWVEYLSGTSVPASKGEPDPRVTNRFAAFCRRFSIDELPQLAHVLSGRMRLVGPRPITRVEWDTYYGPSAAEALSVTPGITGLWQVMGRNRLTYAQRRRLDLFYARHCTPGLDVMLLLRTPLRVLSGRDAG